MKQILKIINFAALLVSAIWLGAKWPDLEPVVTTLGLLAIYLGMEIPGYLKERKSAQKDAIPKPFDPSAYERRRAVYDNLKQILHEITINGEVTNEHIARLHEQKEESNFLFREDITNYISSWIANAVMLQRTNKQIKSGKIADNEFDIVNEKNVEAHNFFANQYKEIINMFRRYLHVDSTNNN